MPAARVVVASNRGPVSFQTADDGSLTASRGGGGLVSGLSSVMSGGEAVWVCSALSDADRQAAATSPGGRLDRGGHDTGGSAVRMLDVDPVTYDRAYNAIANSTLWFVAHHLYDTPNRPVFDLAWRREWAAYVEFNAAFADALAEESDRGAIVVVQDYHLALLPGLLRERRPDLRIGHFTHTPWAAPSYYSLLPDDVAEDLLVGVLGADHAGFLSERWAAAFRDCCRWVLGEAVVGAGPGHLRRDGREVRVGVHALGVDGPALRERAGAADVVEQSTSLRAWLGDRQLVLRVDRTELSKNLVRGLAAYRELLRTRPEWRGKVAHLALAYPSRQDLPEYREYTVAVQRVAAEINDEFAAPGWEPVRLLVNDDYPRSLAALALADVLLVNPIRDGMNLVAKEGPVLSANGCVLVLSREAGAADELGSDALLVNPYDVSQTAAALHAGLSMDHAERRRRTDRLAAAATALPPQAWFAEQLAALSG